MTPLTEAQAWREVARLTVEHTSNSAQFSVPDRVRVAMWERYSFWTEGRDVKLNALAALWLACEAEAES